MKIELRFRVLQQFHPFLLKNLFEFRIINKNELKFIKWKSYSKFKT